MKFIFIICGCFVALTAFSAAQKPKDKPAAKLFDGVISASAEQGIMSVRIRIPKGDHKTPLDSVYLDRRSKTGLDLHVPVSFRTTDDGYEIFMLLPFEYSGKAFLNCMHAAEPKEEGDTIIVSSGVTIGEIYEIPLQPNTPK